RIRALGPDALERGCEHAPPPLPLEAAGEADDDVVRPESETPARRVPRRGIGAKAGDVDWIVEHACSPPRHAAPSHDPLAQIFRWEDEAAREPRKERRAQPGDSLHMEKERERNATRTRHERERPEFPCKAPDHPVRGH